jgi:hypothetical protein
MHDTCACIVDTLQGFLYILFQLESATAAAVTSAYGAPHVLALMLWLNLVI